MNRSHSGRCASHVCPWWFAYTFDNSLRRLVHDPARMLGAFVREGMTVLDAGCGMGHFSIGMARMVGPSGRVIAIDLQDKMLAVLRRRSGKAGIGDRISLHRCRADDLGVDTPVDFALAFWMVHETPDAESFFRQIRTVMKADALLLVAEPSFHVSAADFDRVTGCAGRAGLVLRGAPPVRFSRSALYGRG